MDFFEAQARARQRTSRLILLFILAVLGTIAAGYLAAILMLRQISPRAGQFEAGFWSLQTSGQWSDAPARTTWWDPGILVTVAFGTAAVVGLASLYKWRQFGSGGSAVAESVGARQVDPATTDPAERRLLNVVEEMAIASGMPVPTVYLLPDETAINAFAAGLTTNDAVVAVTRGTLQKLNRDELQGVVAHEFSHILNGDMRMNLRIAAVVFGILVIGLSGRGILWSLRGGRMSRGKNGGIIAGIVALGVALVIIGYVGYFFGRLIQAAVSRQREFLADASAVQFTRNPTGIADALKKIGGYALGSTLQSPRSTAIGHFFFAQAFRTGVTGWWATHPPLAERIRAIDPGFDGHMFDPPKVVDVAHESFVAAGLTAPTSPDLVAPRSPAAAPRMVHLPVSRPLAMNLVGTLLPENLVHARNLLATTPDSLRHAVQSPADACVLLYGLLLDDDPANRARQTEIVSRMAGTRPRQRLEQLLPDLHRLRPEHKLPLLQLSLPALRNLSAPALESFFDVLDELVHADARVSVFEFTLQKLLIHSLRLGRAPSAAGAQIHSFTAVAGEIAVVLSALASHSSSTVDDARAAFARGAASLQVLETPLAFRPMADGDFAPLDVALDRLARTSFAIRQRVLNAATQVAGEDGRMGVAEFELLRAFAAALDCPLPPLPAEPANVLSS